MMDRTTAKSSDMARDVDLAKARSAMRAVETGKPESSICLSPVFFFFSISNSNIKKYIKVHQYSQ